MYELNFTPVFESFDMLLAGAWVTVWMSCIAMILGLIVAILGATLKTSGNRFARIVVGVYVEAIRNTPFLVQLYFIFFALPAIGVRFDPNEAALLALVVNFGAYGTEIVRAGIESIGKGQVEAAMAIGMSRLQVLRHVVLKPALRTIYPALTSQFIYLMLGSSVVSVISATDLTAAGNDLNSITFASFEIYSILTLMYLFMTLVFSVFFTAVGRKVFAYPVSR